MLSLVLLTFGSAAVAYLSTGTANRARQSGAPTHIAGATPAQLCAISAGANASGHVGMPNASVAAVFALLGASNAGFDATPEFLMGHVVLLEAKQIQCKPLVLVAHLFCTKRRTPRVLLTLEG
jgi:hypothetical protein